MSEFYLNELIEGMPIIYNRNNTITSPNVELTLIDVINESDVLPLSKMGKAFKKQVQTLTNILS